MIITQNLFPKLQPHAMASEADCSLWSLSWTIEFFHGPLLLNAATKSCNLEVFLPFAPWGSRELH